ncbi:MAG: hypothetical protein IIZ61_06575 [Lachnospiraceae bacterium]|nr:hypothetical protein [Lachnospiraceae bacterium]
MKQKNKEVQQYVYTPREDYADYGTLELSDYERMETEIDKQHQEQEKITLTKYTDLAAKLEKGDYDRSIYSKWKKKNSKEMEDIIQSTKLLGNILDTEIVEGDDFDGIVEDVKRQYKTVQAACIKYTESHNDPSTVEGKARLLLVKTILEHLASDMRDIEINAEVFKTEGLGAYEETAAAKGAETLVQGPKAKGVEKGPSTKAMGVRLNTILFGHHELKITTDKEKNDDEKLMVGTSEMLTYKKDGKKYFFKKKAHAPDKTQKGVIAYVLHKYKHEIDELNKGADGEFGGLTDEQRAEELKKRMLKIQVFDKAKAMVMQGGETNVYAIRYETKESMDRFIRVCKLDKEEQVVLPELMDNISSMALSAAMAANSGIPLNADLTVRNEATTVMADLLGISDIMMKSQRVTLDLDGKKVEGLRMDEVKGKSYTETFNDPVVIDKKLRYTPEAFSSMMKMQIFDLICGQMDRNDGNYMIQTRIEGDTIIVDSICGIDNDMSFGTLSYQEMLSRNHDTETASRKHKNIEDANGNITIVGLDKEFAERVLALSPAIVETMMGRFLSKDERAALADRLKGVQQAILKMMKEDEERPEGEKRIASSMEDWAKIYEREQEKYRKLKEEYKALKKKDEEIVEARDEYHRIVEAKVRAEHKDAKPDEISRILSELESGGDQKLAMLIEEAKVAREALRDAEGKLREVGGSTYIREAAFMDSGIPGLYTEGLNKIYQKEKRKKEEAEAAKKKAEEEAKKKAEEEAKN